MKNIIKSLSLFFEYIKNFIVNLKEELKACLSSRFKDEEQLRKFINDNDKSTLFDFIKIEHRRWNYFTGFGGFYYDKNKNKAEYKHDCLLSYDELVDKKIDTVLYDLIPLNYLLFCIANIKANKTYKSMTISISMFLFVSLCTASV